MHSFKNTEIYEKVKDGKTGCIIFDFGAYAPYDSNVVFKLGVGLDELSDQKINHRYPNKFYHTISRKYGRRISKIGYPYYIDLSDDMDIDEQLMSISIEYGNAEETVTSIFLLQLNLTKDKPVCGLSLRLSVPEWKFRFESERVSYHESNRVWTPIRWNTVPCENEILLNLAVSDEESLVNIYNTVIEPCSCKIEELMIV